MPICLHVNLISAGDPRRLLLILLQTSDGERHKHLGSCKAGIPSTLTAQLRLTESHVPQSWRRTPGPFKCLVHTSSGIGGPLLPSRRLGRFRYTATAPSTSTWTCRHTFTIARACALYASWVCTTVFPPGCHMPSHMAAEMREPNEHLSMPSHHARSHLTPGPPRPQTLPPLPRPTSVRRGDRARSVWPPPPARGGRMPRHRRRRTHPGAWPSPWPAGRPRA